MYDTYLYHHGIKGQKWGVRRYQNPDGTLTSAGHKRYGVGEKVKNTFEKATKRREDHAERTLNDKARAEKMTSKISDDNKAKKAYLKAFDKKAAKWQDRADRKRAEGDKASKYFEQSENTDKKKGLSDKQKKALKIGAAVIGAAAVAAGTAYVLHKSDVKLTEEMKDYYANKANEYLSKGREYTKNAENSKASYNRSSGLARKAKDNRDVFKPDQDSYKKWDKEYVRRSHEAESAAKNHEQSKEKAMDAFRNSFTFSKLAEKNKYSKNEKNYYRGLKLAETMSGKRKKK